MTKIPSVYSKRVNVYRDHTKNDVRHTDRTWQKAYFAARKTMSHDQAKAVADTAYVNANKD